MEQKKADNYGAPNPSGSKAGLTLLECKNGHAFKIDWQIISDQVKHTYGKIGIQHISIYGLGKFMEDTDRILTRQIRRHKHKVNH